MAAATAAAPVEAPPGFPFPWSYHPDRAIDREIHADVQAAEIADMAAGAHAPRRWICDCGRSHWRGHFMTWGRHRCLGCGYVGTGGTYAYEGGHP